ncbi:tRNA 2-selenouridine(34) synthase MnmH [[Limnothrix rosea] IAM M-220]|uniref:tRNA 2-selenouridine(34) synthase MnmH n=1 Tax=[Limnothrix rosea] IAM M-220 TaxID=454133 RepID=UPI0009592E54|nr:tRNA 2-selenouridine(34) synthase MnmH [[Limnothrix rosea] IAM M-220]OKH18502.1 tRNA 2-selenouridine(34) synthase MnmH [[Limnothrix rosea] IAM M-220]
MAPPIYKSETPWENGFREYDEIIDVRSPGEFVADHIPGAINFPVLSDEERAKVGTIYKQNSPFEARKIGAALVSRNISHHLEQYFLNKPKTYHPLIYCWRGGQRSNSFAHILNQIGWQTTLITGGYKTYRAHVRRSLAILPKKYHFKILCGYTGSAKTFLLNKMKEAGLQVIDLEAIANHRGSLLGQVWRDKPTLQPSQKWFESQLLQQLQPLDPAQPVWLESESNAIGNVHIPAAFWQSMGRSPCYEVEVPTAERVQWLLTEYPHLVNNPDELKRLLQYLIPTHSKNKVMSWFELIDANRWSAFVEAILTEHYDPAYRRSLPCHYSEPKHIFKLQNLQADSVNQFINELNNLLG